MVLVVMAVLVVVVTKKKRKVRTKKESKKSERVLELVFQKKTLKVFLVKVCRKGYLPRALSGGIGGPSCAPS